MKKVSLSLAAAAFALGLAGAALAEGMCGDYGAQTVQTETSTVVASVDSPTTDRK